MTTRLPRIVWVSLVVLLVGCALPVAEPPRSEQTTPPTPAPTATERPLTETSPPTATPAVAPTPTNTPLPTPMPVLTSDDVQRITLAEAQALVDNGNALLYDTRSLGEYMARHAVGAISFPEAEAATRVDELPTDKALIFY